MKKILLIIMVLLPLNLLAQQLECCETKKEVEVFLNGNWKIKNSSVKEYFRYKFYDGVGEFWIYRFNQKGELKEIDSIKQKLEIFKSNHGFQIDYSNGLRLANLKIKLLDSNNLILVREDGRESEYVKISEKNINIDN